MRCLINYIGIAGAPNQTPESGEYINRLQPGLPLEAMVKVTEPERESFLEAWSDIQKRSSMRFNTRIITAAQKKYKIQTIQRSVDLLKAIDKTAITASNAKWRGFTIELTLDKSQLIVYSALQTIYIQTIRLYRTEATAAVQGAIFDLQSGEQLAEFEVPSIAAAGWTNVKIEQRFSSNRVFVAVDATLVDGVELSILPTVVDAFRSCTCDHFGSYAYSNIRGAQSLTLSDEVTDDDLTYGSNTYGMSAVFSVQCSYEPLVCNNKNVFLLAWSYLLAWEILWTRINSSSINRWTIGIDKKRAEQLMSEMDTLFEAEVSTVFDGINMDLNDACLECNATFTYQPSRL